jgi:soluble lytic murein transglycosylase-like protein
MLMPCGPRPRDIKRACAVLGVAAVLLAHTGWSHAAPAAGENAPSSQPVEKPGGAETITPAAQKTGAQRPPISGPAFYRMLVEAEAKRAGLPGAIGEAVMAVESGFDPHALGSAGEIGLMQILPSTAHMLGFAGTNADLAEPEANIHYGVTYLAQAWQLAGHDICTAVMKYRAGHGETRFSYRSVDYCIAVRSKLAAQGFPLTGNVPVATFGESIGCSRKACLIGSRRFILGSRENPSPNLLALNNRLNQIVVNVSARKLTAP